MGTKVWRIGGGVLAIVLAGVVYAVRNGIAESGWHVAATAIGWGLLLAGTWLIATAVSRREPPSAG